MAKTTKRAMKKKPQYVTKPMLKRELDTALAKGFAEQDAKLVAMEHRLSAELASHTKAIMEYVAGMIRVVDEKYADLPGRMAAVEAKLSG